MKRLNALPCLLLCIWLTGCNNEANDLATESGETASTAINDGGTDDTSNANTNSNNTSSRDNLLSSINWEEATPIENSDLVGAVLKEGIIEEATENSPTSDDFSLPLVVTTESSSSNNLKPASHALMMNISAGPIPRQSVRREIIHGDGPVATLGDEVCVRYDMFSWSTGKLVESSGIVVGQTNDALSDNLLCVTLGDLNGDTLTPAYFNNALYNRAEGSLLQLVFGQKIDDLPVSFNASDAFVLLVEIVRVTPSLPDEEEPTEA